MLADEQLFCTEWEMWWEGQSRQGDQHRRARRAGDRKWPSLREGRLPAAQSGHGHTGHTGLGGYVFIPVSCLRPVSNPDPECCVSSAELDAEHTQKALEMEHTQQAKLKERQKFFEEAFQQDMEQYLSTGYLQIAERRGKWGRPWLVGGAVLRNHSRPGPQNLKWMHLATFVLSGFLHLPVVEVLRKPKICVFVFFLKGKKKKKERQHYL